MRGQRTRWPSRTGTMRGLLLMEGEVPRAHGRGGPQAPVSSLHNGPISLGAQLWAFLDVPSFLLSFLCILQGLCRKSRSMRPRPTHRPRISPLRHHPPIGPTEWGYSETKDYKSPLKTIPSNTSTSKELPVIPDRALHPPPAYRLAAGGRGSLHWRPGETWVGKRVRRLAAVRV